MKNILITGASRGIGRGIAMAFAGKDYNIAINCRNNIEKLSDTANLIRSKGSKCEIFQCDVSNYNETVKMFEEINDKMGNIDILINNAGISIVGLFQDMSPDEWNRIINTNLGSVYNCCKNCVPSMINNKYGKIINISSVWGICGASCEVAYSASKGGINAFTKALAKELAPSNIQVNAVACGAIDTDMNSFLDENDMDALKEEIPSGRLGQPEEVGYFIKNLCENNDYLTGQIIQFDGGWI